MGDNFNPGDTDNNLLRKILAKLSGSISATVSSIESILFARAVTGSTYAPAFTEGADARLAVDKTSGGLLTHNRRLTITDDAVVASGDVAHDSPDSGNPLKLGAVARAMTTEPTGVSAGDRVQLVADPSGRLQVVESYRDFILQLASAARTSSPAALTTTTIAAKGLMVFVNVTAVTATPQLTVTIEGADPVSSAYYPLLVSAAISTTGLRLLQVHPALTPVTNLAASSCVPKALRITLTHGNADSITYSVGVLGTL